MIDTVELNNGVAMPWLGFGTFLVEPDVCRRVVADALDVGYRHIDTAMIYQNEEAVGAAMKESGVARDEIFLTTKCWNSDMRAGTVIEACETSLKKLGVDSVDLYLLHWAVGDFVACWQQMQTLLAQGKTRAIGVSNFMVHHLEALLESADVVPAVNQFEFHPYLQSPQLVSFCESKGIVAEAWQPIMGGEINKVAKLVEIGRKHGKTPAQAAIRWEIQRGVVTIPKTTHRERMVENADVFDFELSAEEVAAINALDKAKRNGADPDNVTF